MDNFYIEEPIGSMTSSISKKKLKEIRLESLKYKLLLECESTNGCGICRKFLSTEEIKVCNILVKEGLFDKGIADEKNGTTAFFITHKGRKSL